MAAGPVRAALPPLWWVGAGFAVLVLVVALDLLTGETVLIIALVLGPFVGAFGARARDVGALGVVAVVSAVLLGAVNDITGTVDHIARTGMVAAGSIGAFVLARARQDRDEQLARAQPEVDDARRLRLALEAGEMGTWRWDLASGRVEWDRRLEALYGLEPGTFDGTFDTYASMLHPEDRERTLAAVRVGMDTGTTWRFDHRVRWPDGSVHWLEGRGEPVRDATGRIVGAAGLSVNIDERSRAESERQRLLLAERAARQDAERASRTVQSLSDLTLALAAAASVDDVATTIVHHGLEALDGDYGWFGSVDAAGGRLETRAHEGYGPEMLDRFRAISIDARTPATDVLRTGRSIFIESAADRAARYPEYDGMEVHGSFVVVPLATADELPAVVSFGFSEPRTFTDEDRHYIRAVVEACTQALRRATAYDAEQRSRLHLRTLLDLSEELARLDDADKVLEVTARFGARRIGRWAMVYAPDPHGRLVLAAYDHADAPQRTTLETLVGHGYGPHETVRKVAETGNGVLFSGRLDALPGGGRERAPEDLARLRMLGPVSGAAVPMRVSGRTSGVVVIGDDRPDPLGPTELELAADLGRRSASAFERARLSQLKLAFEHQMVEVLQESIVPERLPHAPGLDIAAAYRPADAIADVGGDWYDAFAVDDCPMIVVVGDVAGHGIGAAGLMGRVRNGLRAYAVEDADPARILERAHEMLCALDPESMVTAVVGCYQPETHTLTWSRAGHPPPLVVRPDGTSEFLEDVNATPLGTLGRNFASATTELEDGALIVLYTDGLIERRHRPIDEGLEWLEDRARSLRHAPAELMCRSLLERSFSSSPSADDMCVLVLRVTGEPA